MVMYKTEDPASSYCFKKELMFYLKTAHPFQKSC
jgi:hypothetical protein